MMNSRFDPILSDIASVVLQNRFAGLELFRLTLLPVIVRNLLLGLLSVVSVSSLMILR